MRRLFLAVALAALLVSLALPFGFFQGRIGTDQFRTALAASSVVWFVFATIYATRKG